MIHTLPRFALRPKQRTPYCLMSDLHIGAADTDERRIKSELDWARANKARVFIAGDVFDAIFLGDPRHTTSVLAKKFRNTDAPLNAVLDHAVDMLRPYADLIDLIGVGNHETKVLAKSGYDMVDLLIERLTAGTKHKIFHGGYMGVIRVPLYYKNASSRHASQYTISYHHGWSGAPGQSKGVLDFNKVRIEGADCIWFGHRHSRTATPEATWYIPLRGDTPLLRHVLNIRTGAYKQASWHQNEGGQHQTKWSRENGMDLMPESMGGARLWPRARPSHDHPRRHGLHPRLPALRLGVAVSLEAPGPLPRTTLPAPDALGWRAGAAHDHGQRRDAEPARLGAANGRGTEYDHLAAGARLE